MTNERPTPETDAEIEGIRNSIKKEYQFDWAIEVARKLERDRDEAREALRTLAEHGEKEMQKLIEERDSAREIYKTLHSLYADEIVKNRKLEQERDETRNKMADALQEVDLRTLDFERIKEERDDALSQIYQAECRAERFCQERDEAIKRYEEISRVFEGANEEEWKPCTTLGETVARILKERDEARQPNKELHSTDPMWQKPLSTNNPIPYTTSP